MKLRHIACGSAVVGLLAGCLSRPTTTSDPTTKEVFITNVKKTSVDKIDLLLMIDNSASMGDKQAILAQAVPDLINRLVTPNCIDNSGAVVGKANPNEVPTKQCKEGKPEFSAITDIHVGVISSALGGFGGDACTRDEVGQNDKAHFITRTKDAPEKTEDLGFLSWFPDNEANRTKQLPSGYTYKSSNAYTDSKAFISAFQNIVEGVGQNGCGLEAQLESVYRFLIQPDPYEKVDVRGDSKACHGYMEKTALQPAQPCPAEVAGYDDKLLEARAAFLRPDSLVAVILLTDEDDSSVDPLSIHGAGWGFMNSYFPGSEVVRTTTGGGAVGGTTAAKASSACDNDPSSAECLSCGFKDTTGVLKTDATCKAGSYYAGDEDSMNVRFHQMKRRFGVDPQYPIKRYVDGFSQLRIPDRRSEHDAPGNYVGSATCVNPLFAASLPKDSKNGADSLCQLTPGTRTPEQVFFAVVGGVPHQLVKEHTGDDGFITDAGWKKLIGEDPNHYNYAGQDLHMMQSITPRPGLAPAAPVGENGNDPIHGREWDTNKTDLQYACTFPLVQPKPCVKASANSASCDETINDCDGKKATPLCSPDDPTLQIRAKAYPTIREFQVVHDLGSQGIVASLCPEEVSDTEKENYGYRPAVRAIVDRLKNALTNTCLPQALSRDEKGEVPCLLLETLADENDTCQNHSLEEPSAEVRKAFLAEQTKEVEKAKAAGIENVVDQTKLPLCQIPQIVKAEGSSCENNSDAGWCYVTKFQSCRQSILLTPTAQVPGSKTFLQCINQFSVSSDDPK